MALDFLIDICAEYYYTFIEIHEQCRYIQILPRRLQPV